MQAKTLECRERIRLTRDVLKQYLGIEYSRAWDITGMVYLPNSNVTVNGAVGKNATGSCFGLVVNTLSISGTGYLLSHNGCAAAGVTLPGISLAKVALVQ